MYSNNYIYLSTKYSDNLLQIMFILILFKKVYILTKQYKSNTNKIL